jgi:hypothetical protein
MRKSHGQSEYTSDKQAHLRAFLHALTQGWRTQGLLMENGLRIAIDCMAGSGKSDDGKDGSPLIINQHFVEKFGDSFRQLCCEAHRPNFDALCQIPLINTDVVFGDYKQIVPDWLHSLGSRFTLHGLIYTDPNGMIDVLEGMPLFRQLQSANRTNHVDLLFNVSLNAYKRHHKRYVNTLDPSYQWAERPLPDILDELATLKQFDFIRKEWGRLEWIMLCGLNADLRLTRHTLGIMPYAEWRTNADEYLNGGRKIAPAQMRMEL